MAEHAILTQHQAVSAVRARLDAATAAERAIDADWRSAQASWERDAMAAMSVDEPAPPQPAPPAVGDRDAAALKVRMLRQLEQTTIAKHAADIEDACAAREAEILDRARALWAELSRLASEVQDIGHTLANISKAAGLPPLIVGNVEPEHLAAMARTGGSYVAGDSAGHGVSGWVRVGSPDPSHVRIRAVDPGPGKRIGTVALDGVETISGIGRNY